MKHKTWTPWLVALVCLGPFAAALFIYFGPLGPGWLPQVDKQHDGASRGLVLAAVVLLLTAAALIWPDMMPRW